MTPRGQRSAMLEHFQAELPALDPAQGTSLDRWCWQHLRRWKVEGNTLFGQFASPAVTTAHGQSRLCDAFRQFGAPRGPLRVLPIDASQFEELLQGAPVIEEDPSPEGQHERAATTVDMQGHCRTSFFPESDEPDLKRRRLCLDLEERQLELEERQLELEERHLALDKARYAFESEKRAATRRPGGN